MHVYPYTGESRCLFCTPFILQCKCTELLVHTQGINNVKHVLLIIPMKRKLGNAKTETLCSLNKLSFTDEQQSKAKNKQLRHHMCYLLQQLPQKICAVQFSHAEHTQFRIFTTHVSKKGTRSHFSYEKSKLNFRFRM
jgi:hypothetical protein